MRNFKNLLKLNKKDATSTVCFGVPLDELVARSKGDVPIVVEHIIQNLEECGLAVEGLFRVSGSATLLQILKKAYDEGKILDRESLNRQCDDCHAMAGLLKMWIRDLPEPLHTYALYDAFVKVCDLPTTINSLSSAVEDKLERTELMRDLLNTLPQPNFVVLKFIMEFLHRVGKNVEQNKMSFSNLAVVFAPTLIRSAEENLTRMMTDSKLVGIGMIMLMEEYEYLFNGAPAPSFLPQVAQVVPVLKVEKYDDAGLEEAEKRNMMDIEGNDRAQRRLSSKQVAHRNLDFTPEKDKSSRRPRLTIQTPNSEEDNLNTKFIISPARPPHSPSKSPHVHPFEHSPALLDLVSQTVGFLFDPSFNVDDTMHLVFPEKEHKSNPTTPITNSTSPLIKPPLSSSLPSSTVPVSTTPPTTHFSPATDTKHHRVPAFDSALNLQEHLRLHLPSSPTSPPSPASDVSFTSTPSPHGGPLSPAFSPSSAPANLFGPILSSSPEISRNRRLAADSIFPPVSPHNTQLGSPLARSSSPSLSLDAQDNSPRRQHAQQQSQQIQQPQPLHTRVLQDSLSRNLSLSSESLVASSPPRPSLFDTARSLQNLPSPSGSSSPVSPLNSVSSPTQRMIESRSLHSLSSSPPLYDRLLESTRSYNSLVTPHPRSQLHISSTNSPTTASSTQDTSSPRPLTAPNRQRSHSELLPSTYHDTPRPTSSLSHSSSRQRSSTEFELENGPTAAYLGPNGKRNARQRAESPGPSTPEKDKDNIYHVKRNRKTWAPENIQNIYDMLMTNNGNSGASSPTFNRREQRDKESSPRRNSSPRPLTSSGSPRDDGPLAHIQLRLDKERKQLNRPYELQLMTTAQIREEKMAIKNELREFDNAYKKKSGTLPKKSDKEILRPLYQRYRDVKDLLTRAENPALPTRTASPRRATTAPHRSLSSGSFSAASSPRITPGTIPPSVYSSVPNLQPFTSSSQLLQQQQPPTQPTQQTQGSQTQRPAHATNLGRAGGRRATMSFGYDVPLTAAQQQQQQQQHQQQQQQKEQYKTLSHTNRSVPNLQKELVQPRADLLASYKSLKSEKKHLQIMLHQYQNDFVKKHGRKVQFVEDREPVRVEYERYKDLKAELATLEEQLLAPTN